MACYGLLPANYLTFVGRLHSYSGLGCKTITSDYTSQDRILPQITLVKIAAGYLVCITYVASQVSGHKSYSDCAPA